MKDYCQHYRRQAHANRVEKKRGDIRQRIFDDSKIRAPDQSDQDKKNVRLERAGHANKLANKSGHPTHQFFGRVGSHGTITLTWRSEIPQNPARRSADGYPDTRPTN